MRTIDVAYDRFYDKKVSISEVDSGKNDGAYRCLACGMGLIAKKEDVNDHHFIHEGDSDCGGEWDAKDDTVASTPKPTEIQPEVVEDEVPILADLYEMFGSETFTRKQAKDCIGKDVYDELFDLAWRGGLSNGMGVQCFESTNQFYILPQ